MTIKGLKETDINAVILSEKIQADGYLNTPVPHAPVVNVSTIFPNRNTRVKAEATRGVEATIKNSLALYYDRKDLALAMAITEDGIRTDVTGFTTTHEALPTINAKYGIDLDYSDVVLENLVDGVLVITASPDSYGWFGSYDLNAAVIEYPPLLRTRSNFLLATRTGLFLRRRVIN